MQVVVLGRGTAPGPRGAPSGGRGLPHRTIDDEVLYHPLDDIGGLTERLTPGRHTLVLAEQRDSLALGRICAGVAVTGETVPVVGVALPHGALALDLLAQAVACQPISPACALQWLDQTAADTWSAAWLPSVRRLDTPGPSLAQHVRSWVPRSAGFLVEYAPLGRVHSVNRYRRGALRTSAIFGGDALPDAALRFAWSMAGHRQLVAAPTQDLQARYGTAAVELAALAAPLPLWPEDDHLPVCGTCGVPVPQRVCPYCRGVVTRLTQEAL